MKYIYYIVIILKNITNHLQILIILAAIAAAHVSNLNLYEYVGHVLTKTLYIVLPTEHTHRSQIMIVQRHM